MEEGGGRIGFVLVEMRREMDESSREPQLAITATSMFPGFRFSPTDVELISHYLKKKLEGSDKCVEVIPEADICKSEPWDLPAKSLINSENEWFFFSYRGRKYPHGSQNKRATESGYWKATGKERNVKSGSNVIGTKRTLVFHTGRAPKGERTEWIMHEYCMSGNSQDSLVVCRLRKNIDFRLNDSQGHGSSNERHLATENSSNVTQSEVGVEQLGVLERAKAVESCSKECSGSHSIEQKFDPESESDWELANELSHLGSSSHQQGYDDDDCYAEILKDDIIDIGKPILPDILPLVGKKTEHAGLLQRSTLANPLLAISVHGSRIRMRFLKTEKYPLEPVEVGASSNCSSIHPNLEQQPKCLILSWGTGHGFIFIVFFFILMLLHLFEFLW